MKKFDFSIVGSSCKHFAACCGVRPIGAIRYRLASKSRTRAEANGKEAEFADRGNSFSFGDDPIGRHPMIRVRGSRARQQRKRDKNR